MRNNRCCCCCFCCRSGRHGRCCGRRVHNRSRNRCHRRDSAIGSDEWHCCWMGLLLLLLLCLRWRWRLGLRRLLLLWLSRRWWLLDCCCCLLWLILLLGSTLIVGISSSCRSNHRVHSNTSRSSYNCCFNRLGGRTVMDNIGHGQRRRWSIVGTTTGGWCGSCRAVAGRIGIIRR